MDAREPVQLALPYVAAKGTLREACDYYLWRCTEGLAASTIESHRRRCELWCGWFGGGIKLEEITYERLMDYVTKRGPRGKGWLHHTIKNQLTTLSVVLQQAVKRGLLAKMPPWPQLRLERERKARIVEREELDKVMALLPRRWRLWLLVAFYTGMRRTCVHEMLWAHVNLTDGTFLRRSPKTHAFAEWFPLHPTLLAELRIEYDTKRPRPTDFVVGKWVLLSRTLRRACVTANVEHFTPTSLRASCRSHLLAAGATETYVNLLLCHSSKVGAKHYTGVTAALLDGGRAAATKVK